MSGPVISSATFAYPDVSGPDRARIATALANAPDTSAFVLNTCLRVEVAVPGGRDSLDVALKELLDDLVEVDGVQYREAGAALTHLYRVAAGLESPVIGEPEILTQFRGALNDGKSNRDGLFTKVLEQAVPVAKTARQLLPFNPHESMASIAAQMVGQAERLAVFGSGAMASSIVSAAKLLPSPPAITMVVRDPARVSTPDVAVLPFAQAEEVLRTFPAIISATSAKTRLIPTEVLGRVLADRSDELTLVDMAMPPDFEPPVGARVRYFDIDVLAARAARSTDVSDADTHVAGAASEVHRRVAGHSETGSVIRHLMARSEDIVEEMVERFGRRLDDASDQAVLRQAVHTATRTLLSDPISFIKDGDAEAVDAVAEAFRFDG